MDLMPTIIDKTTGQRQFVDKTQIMQPQTISDTGEAGGTGLDTNKLLQLYLAGGFGKAGSTGTGRTLTQLQTLGLFDKPSAEMEKKKENKSSLDQRLGVLESLWFPNEDKLALPKAGNFIERQSHKLKKLYEGSSEYEMFRRYARTLGATLAKAAGDTGNIAYAEQAAQLQALADADLTKEEAEVAFKNIRQGLGVPVTDKDYYNKLRKSEPLVQSTTTTGTKTPVTTTEKKTPTDKTNGMMKVNLPGAEAGGELGALAGMAIPLPIGLRTLLGGAIGQTYENVGREGIPTTREAAKPFGSSAGMLAGPLGSLLTQPKTRELLGQVAPEAALDILLNPLKILGGVRGAVASKYGKIPTTTISKSMETATKEAPESLMGQFEKLLPRTQARYTDKTATLPKLMERATKAQNIAYSLKGEPLRAASAQYQRELAQNLRTLIGQTSPVAGGLTTVMSKIIDAQDKLKKLGLIIGAGAVASGAGYGGFKVAKTLGGE